MGTAATDKPTSHPAPSAQALPPWVILSLAARMTTRELCAAAVACGLPAAVAEDGSIELPDGFVAWLEPEPFPTRLLATVEDAATMLQPAPEVGPCSLHISGGTNDEARAEHKQPAAMRALVSEMRERTARMMTPGLPTPIISDAALKIERLTELLGKLLPLATAVILPQAGHAAFTAGDFEARIAKYATTGYYQFLIYVIIRVRPEADGPYVCTSGLFVFGLPDLAIPLGKGKASDPARMANALGNLQREMVAEGWWPEEGVVFKTEVGPVEISYVEDMLFLNPTDVVVGPKRLAVARHRLAVERCAARSFGRSTLHRDESEGVVVDHHLRRSGVHFAMTNGLSLTPQRGGTPEDGNDRVELMLFSDQLGPWASWWLAWVSRTLLGNDGTHPIRGFDRLPLQEPEGGIGAVIVWPRWELTALEGKPGSVTVFYWVVVPVLEEELAAFRQKPGSQGAWIDGVVARGERDALGERWRRVATQPPVTADE